MQKESPKRGWQPVSLGPRIHHLLTYERCRKNHPKGDGNFVLLVVLVPIKEEMQKESPKRGWQRRYYFKVVIVPLNSDAERITQKGMATCLDWRFLIRLHELDAERITQKGMAIFYKSPSPSRGNRRDAERITQKGMAIFVI